MLYRGVSDTVPAPKSMLETFGEGGRSDRLEKAMSTMQGADQIREMESMTARDQKRAEMEQRGLSAEQIAAYLGEKVDLLYPRHPLSFSLSLTVWMYLSSFCFFPAHFFRDKCMPVHPCTLLRSLGWVQQHIFEKKTQKSRTAPPHTRDGTPWAQNGVPYIDVCIEEVPRGEPRTHHGFSAASGLGGQTGLTTSRLCL